jgi:predicted RNase H-like nuclease
MLRGEELYSALSVSHPIFEGSTTTSKPCCIETFPHAVTWHLTEGKAKASEKRRQRRNLLTQDGVNIEMLTNIDWIDAAICALAAHTLARGAPCKFYGNVSSGRIVVPIGPLESQAKGTAET